MPTSRAFVFLHRKLLVLPRHKRSARYATRRLYGELWQGVTNAIRPFFHFLFCQFKVSVILTADIDTLCVHTATVGNVDFVHFMVDFVITWIMCDPGANIAECACVVFAPRGQRNTLISASLPRMVSSQLVFSSSVTSKQLIFSIVRYRCAKTSLKNIYT